MAKKQTDGRYQVSKMINGKRNTFMVIQRKQLSLNVMHTLNRWHNVLTMTIPLLSRNGVSIGFDLRRIRFHRIPSPLTNILLRPTLYLS